MPAPYNRVIIDLAVQEYMRLRLVKLPDVQDCLIKVFSGLLTGDILFRSDIIEPQHHAVDRCQHTILFSINERSRTLYVTRLIYPARNSLRGILY